MTQASLKVRLGSNTRMARIPEAVEETYLSGAALVGFTTKKERAPKTGQPRCMVILEANLETVQQ